MTACCLPSAVTLIVPRGQSFGSRQYSACPPSAHRGYIRIRGYIDFPKSSTSDPFLARRLIDTHVSERTKRVVTFLRELGATSTVMVDRTTKIASDLMHPHRLVTLLRWPEVISSVWV